MVPPELGSAAAIVLVIVSYVTSMLTAFAGIGGGIALIGIMAMLLPPALALPVHAVVQLGSNVGRATLLARHVERRIVIYFAVGGVVGVIAASRLFVALSPEMLQLGLGAFILVAI